MSRRRTLFPAAGLCLLYAAAAAAQTPTPTPTPTTTTQASGMSIPTENTHAVTGVRIEPRPDGSVWFLVPSNDRIVQLQPDGITLKQWQIRDDKSLGANPVDFEIDGNFVWFIENGESLVDAGKSVFARLDTTTGQLREWIVPGSRPAGFWRAPDGKVWLPQTGARLQSLDLATLQVVDYRAASSDGKTFTFAYSDVVYRDGALWLTDFGNNRIVRYVPGATTETSWTMLDPTLGRLNPSQIQFDEKGFLWISELSAARMDRFNPATGELAAFGGFVSPVHFDIFAGRLYVTEQPGTNGRVVVLDPALAIGAAGILTPQTLTVGSVTNKLSAVIRDSTITPTTFTSKQDAIAADTLKTSNGVIGTLRTEFPTTNGYGISAAGGVVWIGTEGRLDRLVLQSIGTAADLSVPVATEFGVSPGARIKIEITLQNRGSAPISGEALYLFSPGSFAPRTTFTVGPGETLLLPDAFGDASSNALVSIGPVRLRVTSGNAGDLAATIRSARVRDDGSSFGFQIPALSSSESLGAGATRTLFTGSRASEVSVLGLFSPDGGTAALTLLAPDGTVRGTRTIALAANIAQEFNPASSAFGVSSEPADVVRLTVSSGTFQAYVSVFDTGTTDVALAPPVAASGDSVIPNLGAVANFASDLFLSNPDRANSANVVITFSPLPPFAAPPPAVVALPPGGSRAITDVLSTLFGIAEGQGALKINSEVPVAASYRVATRTPDGDYAGFAGALDAADAIRDGGAAFTFGTPQTSTRRTHLLLVNRGAAGTVTVIGYDAAGNEVGRLPVPIGSGNPARVNSVFGALGVSDQSAGRIRVEPSAGMRLYAVAAVVDASGDLEITRLRPPS